MGMHHMRERDEAPRRRSRVWLVVPVLVIALALAAAGAWWAAARHGEATATTSTSAGASAGNAPDRTRAPATDGPTTVVPSPSSTPSRTSAVRDRAHAIVAAMGAEERVGQLVMTPLAAGTDPSALAGLIAGKHVGSVILMGNWTDGVDGVRAAVDALRSHAAGGTPPLVATDQEGGLVQHLQGAGFEAMPAQTEQGAMGVDALRASGRRWGEQLHAAGVDVDLAPSVDTVTMDRGANAPIGALGRDYGLDAEGNARHAVAFIEGMRDAGVGAAPKHYPGLGAVSGNTDFTDEGVVDTTTRPDGPEASAFAQTIRESDPGMVMVSLASYELIDPGVPAAFSSAVVSGMLREGVGYDGVVISDSLSASAVRGVDPTQLGVRFVEAGGDVACVDDPSYTAPILQGLLDRASSDRAFADKVAMSAERVVALKIDLGLLG